MRTFALTVIAVLPSGAVAQSCQPSWLPGPVPALNGPVYDFAEWNAGAGSPLLVCAGGFDKAGGLTLKCAAAWDGTNWHPLGDGVNGDTRAVVSYDADGVGPDPPDVIIGGYLTEAGGAPANYIARWNGSKWFPLGDGVGGTGLAQVQDLTIAGKELIVGGVFFKAGGVPVNHIARWNGQRWLAFSSFPDGAPWEIEYFHDQIVQGGLYDDVGSLPVCGVVAWDGRVWMPVGNNPPLDVVHCLTTHDEELIAGGSFTPDWPNNPNNPGHHVAAWDGKAWHALGEGINGQVRALCSFDPDGDGPSPSFLIAGGAFKAASGKTVNNIARWDGANWLPMDDGVNGAVEALAVYQGVLCIGGTFTSASGFATPFFARWGCPQACPADCDRSGKLDIDDFVCFQALYGLGDVKADCDFSGSLDIDDFICFQTEFAQGCP